MTDLTLHYKGKTIALLTEAEIVNNTFDGLINTGYLVERITEAMREFGVFEDLYKTEKVE
jgi:hypothetical protein